MLCSCSSFILNSRYLCKHLVSFYSRPRADGSGRFVVQPPPAYTPQLFQEYLPLIRFSEHDINGPATISSGVDLSDCADDDDSKDDSRSVSYAEELNSLEVVPAGDPEAAEENDENIKDFMRVVHWASGPVCESDPRMQRAFYRYFSNNAALFLGKFKRPYEAAIGISRSVSTDTIRKTPKSYYYSRPQNQSHRDHLQDIYEQEKEAQLKLARQGKAKWNEVLASNSESDVKADRGEVNKDPIFKRTQDKIENRRR
ncbi:hypothetical protein V1515DRAFT_581142 [Lipomyces mesembrius]